MPYRKAVMPVASAGNQSIALLACLSAPVRAELTDFTAGFAIASTAAIGGEACIGPSCQGFLFRYGESPEMVIPPGAASSWVTGVQQAGHLVSGQYFDAADNAHGYVWNLLNSGQF